MLTPCQPPVNPLSRSCEPLLYSKANYNVVYWYLFTVESLFTICCLQLNTLLLNNVYSDCNSIFDFIAVYVRYYECIPGFDSCSLHDVLDYCICKWLYGRADKLDQRF